MRIHRILACLLPLLTAHATEYSKLQRREKQPPDNNPLRWEVNPADKNQIRPVRAPSRQSSAPASVADFETLEPEPEPEPDPAETSRTSIQSFASDGSSAADELRPLCRIWEADGRADFVCQRPYAGLVHHPPPGAGPARAPPPSHWAPCADRATDACQATHPHHSPRHVRGRPCACAPRWAREPNPDPFLGREWKDGHVNDRVAREHRYEEGPSRSMDALDLARRPHEHGASASHANGHVHELEHGLRALHIGPRPQSQPQEGRFGAHRQGSSPVVSLERTPLERVRGPRFRALPQRSVPNLNAEGTLPEHPEEGHMEG